MAPTPFRHGQRRVLLAAADTSAATVAVLLALSTWSITSGSPFDSAFIAARTGWLLAVPAWLIALSHARQPQYLLDAAATRAAIARASAALLVFYLMLFFVAGRAVLPRLMALYFVWDAALLTLATRSIAGWLVARRGQRRRVLVVGDGAAIDSALDILRGPSFTDVGIAGVAGARLHENVHTVSDAEDLVQLAERLEATDLVVAAAGDVPPGIAEGALLCQARGLEVAALSDLYEHTFRRVPVRHLGPTSVLAGLAGTAHLDQPLLAKRVLDLAAGAAVGVVALAATPVIALAIVLDSGRPVFYRQTRLGRGGREFTMTKFRTMCPDAEQQGPQWSPRNDPRTTRVGRVLRRTRLDELPNIWSVIEGDMSMVGPRPERPAFVEMLEREVPLYRARLAVSPGLTGWAQVSHVYTDSCEDALVKLEYDLYYVKHRSFAFDLSILARTVGTMVGLKGR